MGALEEVKTMQEQGVPEEQIIKTLQEKGVPYKDISEALSQSKIKAAVEETPPEDATRIKNLSRKQPDFPEQQFEPETKDNFSQQATQQAPSPETIPGMQQSILQSEPSQESQATEEYMPIPTQQGQPGGYEEYEEEYQPYDYSSQGISPDTITEISEQVVSERVAEMRKHIEKVMDFKTTIEAKTESIEERLKHIEKIIGTLQSSVLKRVGDYVSNVSDIKRELIATQKSFKKIIPGLHKKTSVKPARKTAPKHHKTIKRKKAKNKK